MTRWIMWNLFKWGVIRCGVLLGACVTVKHILADQLGYRMELGPMLIIAVLTVVVTRLWMPWETHHGNDT